MDADNEGGRIQMRTMQNSGRRKMTYRKAGIVFLITVLAFNHCPGQDPAPAPGAPVKMSPEAAVLQKLLTAGQIKPGIDYMRKKLAEDPENDRLRYALGLLQFTRAVERLSQSWYRYGLRPPPEFARELPFLRLPVALNPSPEEADHAAIRGVLQTFLDDLARCRATLGGMKDESASMPVRLGLVRLDLDGDGQAGDGEMLWNIVSRIMQADLPPETVESFVIEFDAADAYWLRGYSHIMSALLEFWLAHDDAELFSATAHLFFERPNPAHDFLLEERADARAPGRRVVPRHFFDAAALVHGMISLPLKEPARMQAVLEHLRQVTAMSRESWRCCMDETDNANEWIPNPKQSSVIPGAAVTPEMISQWMAMLDELDAILKGEKLIAFWRGSQPRGVNIKKVFENPADFDLILWIQGTAAEPYLEYGPLTDPSFWRQLTESFNGRFVPYAIWFN